MEELQKLKRAMRNKASMCQDQPEHAEDYQYDLEDGDIIVSATDGLFDNLFHHEINKITKEFLMEKRKVTPA
jgi:hypothetical protein